MSGAWGLLGWVRDKEIFRKVSNPPVCFADISPARGGIPSRGRLWWAGKVCRTVLASPWVKNLLDTVKKATALALWPFKGYRIGFAA